MGADWLRMLEMLKALQPVWEGACILSGWAKCNRKPTSIS